MPMIYVKAVAGRVARESPKGRLLSSDKWEPVTETPYVRRLIEVHGDLVERKDVPKVVKEDPKK